VNQRMPWTAVVAALVALLAVVLAGSGSTSTATGVPSAAQTYLNSARDVLYEVGSTASTLPDTVKGMSKKPDSTWAAAATKLQAASSQLGQEAARLAALKPPAALKPVQDLIVKGIQAAQSGVDKLATSIGKRARGSATRQANVQSTVSGLQSQLDGLASQLRGALGGALGSPTPSP
jgi:hypothetical protein